MDPLLSIRSLRVEATSSVGTIVAVDKFDLDVYRGDVIGLIGESGSGKTTAVRSILGLTERNVRITGGSIFFEGQQVLGDGIDDLRRLRGLHVGMVFQNASSSLNPLLRINTQMRQVLRANRPDQSAGARRERIEQVISRMGFADPKRVLRSYPHQLSGGMRQRAAIAIAIVSEPELVIADESTSALDVTTQAEVMDLVRELATDMGHSLIYVTHDLLLAAEVCTRMAVMYGGEIVELGPHLRSIGRTSPSLHARPAEIGADVGQEGAAGGYRRDPAAGGPRLRGLPLRLPLPSRGGRLLGGGSGMDSGPSRSRFSLHPARRGPSPPRQCLTGGEHRHDPHRAGGRSS